MARLLKGVVAVFAWAGLTLFLTALVECSVPLFRLGDFTAAFWVGVLPAMWLSGFVVRRAFVEMRRVSIEQCEEVKERAVRLVEDALTRADVSEAERRAVESALQIIREHPSRLHLLMMSSSRPSRSPERSY